MPAQYYIEAFDKNGREILGNLDGQNALRCVDYKRTLAYKGLSTLKTLNNRVKFYRVVDYSGNIRETVYNKTFYIGLPVYDNAGKYYGKVNEVTPNTYVVEGSMQILDHEVNMELDRLVFKD